MLLREAEILGVKAGLQRRTVLSFQLRHDFSRAQTTWRVLSWEGDREEGMMTTVFNCCLICLY